MDRDLAPDWILQQTLAIQQKAHSDWLYTKPELRPDDDGLTLTVLGCGTMGSAILSGILHSLDIEKTSESSSSRPDTQSNPRPQRLPTKFNACVRTAASAKNVRRALEKYNANLSIHENDNVRAVQTSDVILLCCEPRAVDEILRQDGMVEALAGKILVSILGGASLSGIDCRLHGAGSEEIKRCTVIRAMPNAAAAVRQSMTVIAESTPPLPEETNTLVTWIFSQVGTVAHVPAARMDAYTALCGAGPAFAALVVEAMAAGAIAMGVSREQAYAMAAQTMHGTSDMLLHGEHPALLRDKVTTPGGCTIAGLNVLEEEGVRGSIAKAVREAAKHLKKSGAQIG